MTELCICGCGQPAIQLHHVVYQQAIRRAGGDVKDTRNLVPVSFACHGAHHNRQRPIALNVLPDSVYRYARELLGDGVAYEYLRRYYGGDDPRLDELLMEDAA